MRIGLSLLLSAAAVVSLALPSARAQAVQCAAGSQPFGTYCISQFMADYIACVETSGGNRQEIRSEMNAAIERRKSAQANVSGGNRIASGKAGLALGSSTEQEAVEKIESKWFPSGMSVCAKVLGDQRKSTKQNTAPPRKEKKVSPAIGGQEGLSKKVAVMGTWAVPELHFSMKVNSIGSINHAPLEARLEVVTATFQMPNVGTTTGFSQGFQEGNEMYTFTVEEVHFNPAYVFVTIKKM